MEIRKEFKIFDNSNVIYFDNSATTQKPQCVLDAMNKYYLSFCANSGRGSYPWANKSTKIIETTRKKVAEFLNTTKDTIFFTSGATYASNLITYSWALNNLRNGDEIMLCYTDHKSTVLPWINIVEILKSFNIDVKIVEILRDTMGDYKEADLLDKVNEKTKVVVLTHIHNVYGLENNCVFLSNEIKEINKNTKIVLDACQSAGHIKIDLNELNVDFLYFSGHKMFADTGVGAIYIEKETQKVMRPFVVGGNFNKEDIVKENLCSVERESDYFECGTLNIPSIISLGSAIDFINSIGIENIEQRLYTLTRYLYDKLKTVKNIEFDKGIDKISCKLGYGIISFRIENFSSNEIGTILADYDIFVRTGKHCSTDETEDTIRVSLQIYNTEEEIDTFVKVLNEIITQN